MRFKVPGVLLGALALAPALLALSAPSFAQSGLVAAYGFNQGSGSTLADASGNGNTGTISGATWSTQGRFGSALSFDGNDQVSIPSAASLNLTTAMTLEAWVFPTASQSNLRAIVVKGDEVYALYSSNETGAMKPAGVWEFTGDVEESVKSPTAIAVNVWTHLAVTYDGAMLRLYVNGAQVASKPRTGNIATNSQPLRIGGNGSSGEFFKGRIDEVRVYNRALSQAEIQTDMNAPIGGTTGPIAAYGLNALGGTSAKDYSGNNLNGTLQSGAAWTTAGKSGSALVLNGLDGYVNLGNPTPLQLTGSMTASAWINSSAFPQDDAPIVSKKNFDGKGYQLDTTVDTGTRTIGFKLTNAAGADIIRYGTTALQLNEWYYVTGVYNASAQTLDVYLNGVLDNGTLLGSVPSTQQNTSVNVNIGRRSGADWYLFGGLIDEVRIYNRALSASEIQADMNAAVVPAAADTTAPAAPTALAAIGAASQVSLSWTSSTDNMDVTGYRVERCQGTGCANFAEVATATTLMFIDSGLAVSTTYRYRLRAADAAGNLSGYSSVVSATTLSTPLVGGRVGAYPFSEGSGATTEDFSGLVNTGTLDGANWTSVGKLGNGLYFSGSNAFVNLGNPAPLRLLGSMTVSAWINSAAFPADDAAIVSKLDGTAFKGFQLDTTVDTGPRTIGFKLSNAAGLMMRYGTSVLQLGQWYHVAGVYDAQARTLNVYLNGVLDNGSLVGPVTHYQLDSPLNVNIGQRPDWALYQFNGTIDEVRIYNRALTQAEIQADMNASASGPDVTPPSAPAGLTASAVGASQIDLGWTASTDNVGVAGYQVERCQGTGCSTFAQIATPTATSFSDMGLTAAASYSYRVRATDAAGNLSAYSNVASATVTSAAPIIFGQTPKDVTLPGGSTPLVGAAYSGVQGGGIDVASVRIHFNGVDVTSQATVTESGVLYPVTQPLPDATHTVSVSVASLAGGVATETWTFVSDDPAPNFYSETPRDVSVANRNPRIRVLLSGFNIALSSVRMFLDGGDVTAQADVGTDHIVFTPASPLGDGLHTVSVNATDGRGVSAGKQWSFTVALPPPPSTTEDGSRSDRTFVPRVRVVP